MNNTEPTETKQRPLRRIPIEVYPVWEGSPHEWIEALRNKQTGTEWLRLDWAEVRELGHASITLAAIRHFLPRDSNEFFAGQDRIAVIAQLAQSTTEKHFLTLEERAKLTRIPSERSCNTYLVSRRRRNSPCGMLPRGYLSVIKTFAERCLFALAISGTEKIQAIDGVVGLDAGHAIMNCRVQLAQVTQNDWEELTGLDSRTLRRARDRLQERGLIARHSSSVWIDYE